MRKILSLIFILVFILGVRFVTFYSSQKGYTPNEQVNIIVELHEEPDVSNNGQKFSIKTSTNQTIFITVKASPRLHYGQKIELHGKLQEKEIDKRRKILIMRYPKIYVRDDHEDIVLNLANNVRERSDKLFKKTLPPTSASLLSGIVFGSKEHFSQDFSQSLSTTGVLHVIAASGTNVTFVGGVLLYVLGYFFRRRVALLVASAGIIFYVFLVGFEPSIIRASIMALFAFGASLLGRQNYAYFSLFLAGIGMLLWKPYFLFDVGFQLSFMATLGILLFGEFGKLGDPGVAHTFIHMIKAFRESIATTFAAQVATLPILLGVFGSFGIFSLLVNGLVLWVIPPVMTLGSLAIIVGFLFEPLAQIVLFCCLPFLLFFESVVSFFGSMNGSIAVERFSWPMALGYYLLLAAIMLQVKSMRNSKHKITNSK